MEKAKHVTPNDVAKVLGVENEYNKVIVSDLDNMFENFTKEDAVLFENNIIDDRVNND